jgi:hypothetical protein
MDDKPHAFDGIVVSVLLFDVGEDYESEVL